MMNSLTKQQCEWPDSARPGVPMNPEKEGPHWLRYEHDGYVEVSAFLWERDGYWVKSRHVHYSEWPGRWTYLGPVLTPDEVQNLREADAVKRRDAEQKLLHRDNLIEELVAMGSRNRSERDALQARVAEDNRPSEEIIREDRDAWPDRQQSNIP